MRSRHLIAAACAVSLMAIAASSSAAAVRHTSALRAPAARMWGAIPSGRFGGGPARPRPAASRGAATVANLAYHGGPVMHTNTTYTIYWGPSAGFAAGYGTVINQFLTDVGAQSGSTNNVYGTDTQYYDTFNEPLTPISYTSAFVATWNDTTTPIPNHCSGEYSGTGVTVSGCLLDSDIQAEVARAIVANGWPDGLGAEYFVMTPVNAGSCFDSSSRECSYTYYCAYHSDYIDGAGNPVLYANMPYSNSSGVGAPGACDVGQHPNNNQADATINVLSHEHNETITDPLGNAWWDSSGNEIGDKCAWNFGTVLGSTASGEFNEVIHDHFYWLQQEWSNASSGCVQHYGTLTVPSISSLGAASGGPGTQVTISGANLDDAYAVAFNGAAATFTDTAGAITATVPAGATTGPVSVTTVGGTAKSAASFGVPPTISGFSPSSGPVGSSVAISGGGFSNVTGVTIDGLAATYTVNSASKITATVPAGASGSGAITVATGAGTATSATQFTVTAAAADFTLGATASVSVSPGATGRFTVTITRLNGFTGSVSLSASGVPSRASASFSPNPASTTSTLSVATNRRTPAGTYTLTITGTSGSLKHTVQVKLTVT